jgi:uncharacterized protein YjbJ (UPF0337 family)
VERDEGPFVAMPFGRTSNGTSVIRTFVVHNPRRREMVDKDRVEGSANQAKGKVKEVAGRVTGDNKLQGEGKADQLKGKVQNAVGGVKDTLRGK